MIKGSCLCGNICYEIVGDPKQINLCHCTMCQKFSGTAFGAFMRVSTSDYQLTKGKEFEKIYDRGDWAQRVFCGECGSSTLYINKEAPEWLFVAAGTLDSDPGIKSHHHIYVKDSAHWYDIDAKIPQFSDYSSSVENNI